ncbi:MAG TPA: NUDIX hydrolase [Verrucomicrobiales bacterium]|nr:NUDIX hydrolase [Verrucomicrobiales bacterium]
MGTVLRNIIFDWSGTLIDDLPAVWEATNHVFAQAGLPPMTLEQFRSEFCLPFQKFYRRHTPDVDPRRLEEWFHGRFRQVQDRVRELPHARTFLEGCRARGIRTFLLSTIHRDHYAEQVAVNGFDRLIDRPYLEAWDKREWIHRVLEENGLDPRETLFIGDMEHDVETAHHAGVFSCAVLTGYTPSGKLRESRPHLIVEHLGELQSILDRTGYEIPAPGAVTGLPVATVGALIFNDEQEVLMVRTHKWSNLWGIPGGKIKLGETAEAALCRELAEETGLAVEEIRFVLVQDCIRSKEFYREAHFVLLNYTCRARGATPVRLNEEAQEFRWLPPEAALSLPLNHPTRILLEAVLASTPAPAHG